MSQFVDLSSPPPTGGRGKLSPVPLYFTPDENNSQYHFNISSFGNVSSGYMGMEDGSPLANINVISLESSPETAESQRELTDEERIQKELEESEQLAWELMRQEQEQLYQMQVNFMRDNAAGMSEADLALIQSIVDEPARVDEQEEEMEEGENPDNWDYEQLLQLGNVLGDVKTERWRMRAKQIIDNLPVLCMDCITPEMQLKVESKCVICMGPYESSDEVKVLPCKHYFHSDCLSGWLADHNKCPLFCKIKASASP